MYNPDYFKIIQCLIMDTMPNQLDILLKKKNMFPEKMEKDIIKLIINFMNEFNITEVYKNASRYPTCHFIERIEFLVQLILNKYYEYDIICIILEELNLCKSAITFKYKNVEFIILDNDINKIYWDCNREEEENPQWLCYADGSHRETLNLDEDFIGYIKTKNYLNNYIQILRNKIYVN